MKKLFGFFALIALSAISSCSKEEGPQGPAGPQGPKGATGSANIIVRTYTIYSSEFLEYGTPGQQQHHYSATRSIPEITSDVYNSGMVVVYYQGFNTTPPPWYSLPQTIYESGHTYTLTYAHYLGGIAIQRYDSNLYSLPPSFTLTIKVVIVPPSTGKKEWDVNWKDYNAVKKYFNLKD